MKKFTVGSLFAGIGGFDLGFERAGFKTSWQVENNEYCRKVLAKNFPHADRSVTDVRDAGSHNLSRVDVICGGFPCQDISNAGLRAGITGERSGLWSEFARIIRELRPAYVLVENVAALLGRGMGVVLGDLAEIGYDAEWEIVSANDAGAPHLRERVWIVGYAMRLGHLGQSYSLASTLHKERNLEAYRQEWPAIASSLESRSEDVGNSKSFSSNGKGESGALRSQPLGRSSGELADPERLRSSGPREPVESMRAETHCYRQAGKPVHERIGDFWAIEPNVGRVAHGIPKRVDRLRGLGNAVVPQIPEMYAWHIRKALAMPVKESN